MDIEVRVAEGEDFVRIRIFVPMNNLIGERCARQAARLGEEHGLKKFLFDLRGAPNIQSVAQNYVFAYDELPQFEFPRASISAFVIDEGDSSHEFIELAFQNAGYIVKSFTDEDAAIKWLASY
ncbi:hypothetical protein [Geoalkalibacter halelectricus]|uniref:hypothetical protein n=1 Tax=Geoalkalibacter halelectricus TaxID=2847045 RepID=UPI003D23C39A